MGVLWIEDLIRQMNTSEKPRDVSGVELLMNNHQSLKAEIDARGDNFSACIALGKELLSRGHYATTEIKEKLVALTNQRNAMLHRWEERWEHLQLILEVYQFARDAAVAEGWLMAQENYLTSHELGHTIDEVENLIKKHEAFEKSAAAQEERFAALERLTTYELKELKRRQEEEERIRAEELAAHEAALAALHSPPEGTHPDQTDGDTSPSEPISASTEKELATEATEVHGSRVDDSSSSSSPALRQTISSESPDRPSSEKRRSSTAGGDDSFEGTVNRKHEWDRPRRKHRTDPGTKSIWFCVMENWPSTKIKNRPELHHRFTTAMKIPSTSAAPRRKKLPTTPRNATSSVSSCRTAVNFCSKPKMTMR